MQIPTDRFEFKDVELGAVAFLNVGCNEKLFHVSTELHMPHGSIDQEL